VSRPLAETWARRPLMLCVRSIESLPAATKLLVQWLTERQEKARLLEQCGTIAHASDMTGKPQLLAV
jgi:hypothetical protein